MEKLVITFWNDRRLSTVDKVDVDTAISRLEMGDNRKEIVALFMANGKSIKESYEICEIAGRIHHANTNYPMSPVPGAIVEHTPHYEIEEIDLVIAERDKK